VYNGNDIAIDDEAEEPIKLKAKFMENGSKIKECLKWPPREDIMELTPEARYKSLYTIEKVVDFRRFQMKTEIRLLKGQ